MEELNYTTEADDIDMLLCLLDQVGDGMSVTDVSVAVKDTRVHCKHWSEVGAAELIVALREKYKEARRLKIPSKFLTDF